MASSFGFHELRCYMQVQGGAVKSKKPHELTRPGPFTSLEKFKFSFEKPMEH